MARSLFLPRPKACALARRIEAESRDAPKRLGSREPGRRTPTRVILRAANASAFRPEELLRFPGRILAVKHVAGDDESIDIPLYDYLFEPLKHFAVLMLPRETA